MLAKPRLSEARSTICIRLPSSEIHTVDDRFVTALVVVRWCVALYELTTSLEHRWHCLPHHVCVCFYVFKYSTCFQLHVQLASRHRRSANLHNDWSFRGIDVTHSVSGPSLSRSDRLEFTACRIAWTGCKQRCLSVHIEDDPVREILVHRARLRCFAWNCAI